MSEFYRHIIMPLLFTVVLLASCAPSDELRDDEMDRMLDEAIDEYGDLAEYMDEMTIEEELDEQMMERLEVRAEELLSELPELAVNLEAYRSRFSDQQAGFRNEIPENYLKSEETEGESEYRDRNRGFRIQIISTQDTRLADEIREDFEEWISNVSAPPHPHTYMVFHQPDYRVHVGDFLDRQRALEFADFIRLRYPDAWVVHSRIHPGRVKR